LKFFGGLSIEEIAEVLGIGHATVERDWKMARAWLRRQQLQESSPCSGKNSSRVLMRERNSSAI
jgi:transposase